MSKCRRCNRTLTRDPYKTLGIGKICQGKESHERDADNSEDLTVPYHEGNDIFIERLGGFTQGVDGLEVGTNFCSGTRTNVPKIKMVHGSGFNFGYGGSGPADFALNVLMMFTDPEQAYRLHQEFKWQFVAPVKEDKLVISSETIKQFIHEKANS